MAYPTASEIIAYLHDQGYSSSEISSDRATRLQAAAISEWDSYVGCVPFLAVESLKSFDPRDIQADRRGWILDLPCRIASDPSLIKSGVIDSFPGTTLELNKDYELPDSGAPYTQLVFLIRPTYRLQITALWGHTTDPSADVADAICSLCAARYTQETQGKLGIVTEEKVGMIDVKYSTTQYMDVVSRLRAYAQELAARYQR
jgi:hypothetical protein